MTKLEYGKCEKLMEDAIQKAITAKEEFEMIDMYIAVNDSPSMIALYDKLAAKHHGYAEGINQVLATLGFKHDRMKELSKLL